RNSRARRRGGRGGGTPVRLPPGGRGPHGWRLACFLTPQSSFGKVSKLHFQLHSYSENTGKLCSGEQVQSPKNFDIQLPSCSKFHRQINASLLRCVGQPGPQRKPECRHPFERQIQAGIPRQAKRKVTATFQVDIQVNCCVQLRPEEAVHV